jgi:hypothetical protein
VAPSAPIVGDLEVTVGQTYTFDQTDETNWFHPIGFAYFPDGAHTGRIEVLDDSTHAGRARSQPDQQCG